MELGPVRVATVASGASSGLPKTLESSTLTVRSTADRSMMAHQPSNVMTSTEFWRRNQGAQATDFTYTTTYQTSHCYMAPTSPPPQLKEFPPQRADLVPGEGNFVVGAVNADRSCQFMSPKTEPYRGSAARAERGTVNSPHMYLDSFASSLRKYPNLSPDRSTEILDRLINYSKSRNLSPVRSRVKSPVSPSQCDSETKTLIGARSRHHGDQDFGSSRRIFDRETRLRRDEVHSPTRLGYNYFGYEPFRNEQDVRYLTGILRSKPMFPSNKDFRSPERHVRLNAVHTQTQAAVQMVSKQTTTAPRTEIPSQQNIMLLTNSSPCFQTTSQTRLEIPELIDTCETQPNETLLNSMSSISIFKIPISPSVKSEETSSDVLIEEPKETNTEILPGENLCHNEVRKCSSSPHNVTLGNFMTQVWIVGNKTFDLYRNAVSGISEESVDDTNFQNFNNCPEEIAVTLMHELITNFDLIEENIKKGLLLKLCKKLKQILINKNTHIIRGNLKHELVKLLSELPIKLQDKLEKTEYINCLGDLLISKIEDLNMDYWEKSDQKRNKLNNNYYSDTQNINPLTDKYNELKRKTKTYVVLQASDAIGLNPDTTDFSIRDINQDDIEANLQFYTDQVNNEIDKWLTEIVDDTTSRQSMAKELASNIVDALKSTELNLSGEISEEEEYKIMSAKISSWVEKSFGQNHELLKRVAEILQIIRRVPVPMLSSPDTKPQQDRNLNAQPQISTPAPAPSYSQKPINTSNQRPINDFSQIPIIVTCNKPECPQTTSTPNADAQNAGPLTLNGSQAPSSIQKAETNSQLPVTMICERSDYSVGANLQTDTPAASTSQAANFNSINRSLNNHSSTQPAGQNLDTHNASNISAQSNPPTNLDAIHFIDDHFRRYIDKWLQLIPINATTAQEIELAELARKGILNGYMKALRALDIDPEKIQNIHYYEDILDDVLENLLNLLPQTAELKKKKPGLKANLIKETLLSYRYLFQIPGTVSYRIKVREQMLYFFPQTKSRVHFNYIYVIFQLIADNYIMYIGNKLLEDEDIAQVFMQNCESLIEKACRVIVAGDFDCEPNSFRNEILDSLQAVPIPRPEVLMGVVDLVNILRIVRNWSEYIRPHQTFDMEMSAHVHGYEESLGNKICRLEKTIGFDDIAGVKALTAEVIKFLEQVPLSENIDITEAVNTLQKMLKNRIRYINLVDRQGNDPFGNLFLPLQNENFLNDLEVSSLPGNLIQHHLQINPDLPYQPDNPISEYANYSQFADDVPRSSSRDRILQSDMNRPDSNQTRLSESFGDDRRQTFDGQPVNLPLQPNRVNDSGLSEPQSIAGSARSNPVMPTTVRVPTLNQNQTRQPASVRAGQQSLPTHQSVSLSLNMPHVQRRSPDVPQDLQESFTTGRSPILNNYGDFYNSQGAGQQRPQSSTPFQSSPLRQTLPNHNSTLPNQSVRFNQDTMSAPRNENMSSVLRTLSSQRSNFLNQSMPNMSRFNESRVPQSYNVAPLTTTSPTFNTDLGTEYTPNSSRFHQSRLTQDSNVSRFRATSPTFNTDLGTEYTPNSSRFNQSGQMQHSNDAPLPDTYTMGNSNYQNRFTPPNMSQQNRIPQTSNPLMATYSTGQSNPYTPNSLRRHQTQQSQRSNAPFTQMSPTFNSDVGTEYSPISSRFNQSGQPQDYNVSRFRATSPTFNTDLGTEYTPNSSRFNQSGQTQHSNDAPLMETYSNGQSNQFTPNMSRPNQDRIPQSSNPLMATYSTGQSNPYTPNSLRRNQTQQSQRSNVPFTQMSPTFNSYVGTEYSPISSRFNQSGQPQDSNVSRFRATSPTFNTDLGTEYTPNSSRFNQSGQTQHSNDAPLMETYSTGQSNQFTPNMSRPDQDRIPQSSNAFLETYSTGQSNQFTPTMSQPNQDRIPQSSNPLMATYSTGHSNPYTPNSLRFNQTQQSHRSNVAPFTPTSPTLNSDVLIEYSPISSRFNQSGISQRSNVTPLSQTYTLGNTLPTGQSSSLNQYTLNSPTGYSDMGMEYTPNSSRFNQSVLMQHSDVAPLSGTYTIDNSNYQNQYTPNMINQTQVLRRSNLSPVMDTFPRGNTHVIDHYASHVSRPYEDDIPQEVFPPSNLNVPNQHASHITRGGQESFSPHDGSLSFGPFASNINQQMHSTKHHPLTSMYGDFHTSRDAGRSENSRAMPPMSTPNVGYPFAPMLPTLNSTLLNQYRPFDTNTPHEQDYRGLHTSQVPGPSGNARPITPNSFSGSHPHPSSPYISRVPNQYMGAPSHGGVHTPQTGFSSIQQTLTSTRYPNKSAHMNTNENKAMVPYRQHNGAFGSSSYPDMRQQTYSNAMARYPTGYNIDNADYNERVVQQEYAYFSDYKSDDECFVQCRCLERFNGICKRTRDGRFYCDGCDCLFYFYSDTCFC